MSCTIHEILSFSFITVLAFFPLHFFFCELTLTAVKIFLISVVKIKFLMLLKCLCGVFKMLHPKIKLLSSFTHPQIVATLYEFVSSAENKGTYFEERLAPLTSIVFLFFVLKKLFGSNCSSKYLPLCSALRNELKQVCNNLRVTENMTEFLGGVSL